MMLSLALCANKDCGNSAANGAELIDSTRRNALATKTLAYAVSTPLIGGGVAEWLKAAVC